METIMSKNILITSAGKRVSLVKEFKSELRKSYPDGKVYVTELNPLMSPAVYVADGFFKVPRVTDESYINSIIKICSECSINLIIPTIDTELLILTSHLSDFKLLNIDILISDKYFIEICRDKRLSNDFFISHKVAVPQIIDINNPVFPIFAKPYDGSLSQGIHIIKNISDVTKRIKEDNKLIFMEFVDSKKFKEFTIDLYFGRDNKIKCIVPRERVEIRAGEVNKAYARKNYLVDFIKSRFESIPGARGCLCMQVFYNEKNDQVYGIEINPRFGGGYPLTFHTGANFQEFIIKEYFLNKDVEYYDEWEDNTLMLRYDDEIIVYPDEYSNI